jgi:hypothetical protein
MHYGRGVAMAAMGWVLGCGPSVGGADPGTDGGTADDTTGGDDSSSTASATITTTTTDPSGPDTGEDTSPDESTGADGPTICTDAGPTTPIAVLAADSGAIVLHADGTQLPLDLPPAGAPRDANVYASFATRGSWVAMTRTTSYFDGGVQYGTEVALFTTTGERQWLRDEPNVSLAAPLLAGDGVIVAARSNEASSSDGVRYTGPDDALTLPGIHPRGEQRDDGLIPGWRSPSDGIEPVWIDTATLALQPISLAVLGGWLELEDGEFTYFTASGGDVALVREGPGGPALSALPELGEASASGYGVTSSSDRRWLLVTDGIAQAYFRVDTDAGTAEPLDLTPPPDLVPFECYGIDPTIDDAGRIVMALRDASAVYFGRLEPATGVWDILGDPVTAVDDAAVSAHGDTYILRTSAQGTTFCPPQEFEPVDDVLFGATAQVLRPIDGTSRTLDDETWPVPRSDGRCIAITDAEGMTLVDLQDDTELVVPGMRDVYWWVD